MTPEPVIPGLWRVGGGTWSGTVAALSAEDDANAYLLRGPAGAVLVDCGSPEGRPAIEANVRAIGGDGLGDLLLTHSHWDHTCAARAWQAERGLRTHLNARGAASLAGGDLRLVGVPLHGPGFPFEPFAVDHAIADGERFELAGMAVEAQFMPGHTLDSTVFLLALDGVRTGIVGDVAFGPKAGRLGALGFLCALWQSERRRLRGQPAAARRARARAARPRARRARPRAGARARGGAAPRSRRPSATRPTRACATTSGL